MTTISRRGFIKTLTCCASLGGLASTKGAWSAISDTEMLSLKKRMKQAEERDALEVEQLYSTKPVRVSMGRRTWQVPVNYWTPKGADAPEASVTDRFGFFLFLPDFGGYTKENWVDQFDLRRVEVLEVSSVDKDALIPNTRGERLKVTPSSYGEPRAGFENIRPILEDRPSFKLFGLEGYKRKGAGETGTRSVTWTGTRSNGEFFFFNSSLRPGESTQPGITNPSCQTQYYSEKEDLFIAYRYSQHHIAQWREIDNAIWSKLHSWQLR